MRPSVYVGSHQGPNEINYKIQFFNYPNLLSKAWQCETLSEPIQKVVESDESVVIPYSAPGFFGEVSDVEA
jgi:hypothetical protein